MGANTPFFLARPRGCAVAHHPPTMTFKGTPPTEPASTQAPPQVPSELEIATKWDNCVENTIKSVAIGVAVTIPIFFFASMLQYLNVENANMYNIIEAGWMRGLFLGGGMGYGLGSGIGDCRTVFSRPLETPLVRVRKATPSSPLNGIQYHP